MEGPNKGQVPGMPNVSPMDRVKDTSKIPEAPAEKQRTQREADVEMFTKRINGTQQRLEDFGDHMTPEEVAAYKKRIDVYSRVIEVLN